MFFKKNRKFKENLDFSVGILDFSGTEGGFAGVLTLLLCRELLNAHLRRRRQSSLKYGQGLQGEAPKFLSHLAIIGIKRALRRNHIAVSQKKKDLGDSTMDAQTRDPAGSHVVACMRPWTIALPSWILRPFTVSKEAIR